jgi:hypothetical protein
LRRLPVDREDCVSNRNAGLRSGRLWIHSIDNNLTFVDTLQRQASTIVFVGFSEVVGLLEISLAVFVVERNNKILKDFVTEISSDGIAGECTLSGKSSM